MGATIRAAEIEAVLTARDQMTAVLRRAKSEGLDLGGALRGAAGSANLPSGPTDQLREALASARGNADALAGAHRSAGAAGATAGSEVAGAMRGAEAAARSAEGGVGGLRGALGSLMGQAASFAAGGFLQQGISKLVGAVSQMGIGMNASLETSTLQFTTLMGNADEARDHVKMLFQFAKDTPFETAPVVQASRMLRTFGGSALDTKGNLTMVGDAAAATGSDISDLSFWVGRMYAGLQAGQPIGEAVMRLQELAVLSPQTAAKLQQMQAAGAKGSEIWKVVTSDFNRFGGAMKAQAGTWAGLTSSLSDAINITGAQILQPFFKKAEGWVGNFLDFISGDAVAAAAQTFQGYVSTALDAVEAGVGGLVAAGRRIGDFLHMLAGTTVGKGLAAGLQELRGQLEMLGGGESGPISLVTGPLLAMAHAMGAPMTVIEGLTAKFDLLEVRLFTLSRTLNSAITRSISGFFRDLRNGADPIQAIIGALTNLGVPFPVIEGLVTGLRAGLSLLKFELDTGVKVVTAFWTGLQGGLGIVREVAERAWPTLRQAGSELMQTFGELGASFGGTAKVIGGAAGDIDKGSGGIKNIKQSVDDAQGSFLAFLASEAVGGTLAFLAVNLPAAVLVTVRWFKVLADSAAITFNTIAGTIRVASDVARGDYKAAWNDMVATGQRNGELMKTLAQDTQGAVTATNELMDGTVEHRSETFKNRMISMFREMKDGTVGAAAEQAAEVDYQHQAMRDHATHHAAETRDNVSSALGQMRDNGISAAVQLRHGATDAASGLPGDLYSVGSNAATSFASGIRDYTGWVRAQARQMAREAAQEARDEIQQGSPSKVFREIGNSIPQGFALGIRELQHQVTAAVRSITPTNLDLPGVQSALGNAPAPAMAAAGMGGPVVVNVYGDTGMDPYQVGHEVRWAGLTRTRT